MGTLFKGIQGGRTHSQTLVCQAYSHHHLSNLRHPEPFLISCLVIMHLQRGVIIGERERERFKYQRTGKRKSHFLALFHTMR